MGTVVRKWKIPLCCCRFSKKCLLALFQSPASAPWGTYPSFCWSYRLLHHLKLIKNYLRCSKKSDTYSKFYRHQTNSINELFHRQCVLSIEVWCNVCRCLRLFRRVLLVNGLWFLSQLDLQKKMIRDNVGGGVKKNVLTLATISPWPLMGINRILPSTWYSASMRKAGISTSISYFWFSISTLEIFLLTKNCFYCWSAYLIFLTKKSLQPYAFTCVVIIFIPAVSSAIKSVITSGSKLGMLYSGTPNPIFF